MNGISDLGCVIIIVPLVFGVIIGWFSHKWYGHIPLDGTKGVSHE